MGPCLACIVPCTIVMNNEHALVMEIKAGHEEAFSQLVRRYHASLIALAGVFVATHEVAEEVVQDAWLGVLQGIDRFEERASFKTWVSRIVMNIARTRAVREKRMLTFSDLADAETGESYEPVDPSRFQGPDGEYPDHWSVAPRSWNRDPEQSLLSSETMKILERAVGRLPRVQRLVLTLRDVHGWSSEEVCNALGLSEANHRVLLHRGRSRVRGALEQHYSKAGPTRRADSRNSPVRAAACAAPPPSTAEMSRVQPFTPPAG